MRDFYNQLYTFTDVEELDVTDSRAVEEWLSAHPTDYIINCAAYTDVDGAESEPEKAMILNRDAVKNLLDAVDKRPETRLIHISTDYVFKGDIFRPLKEDDRAEPQSVYGKTKLEGEKVLEGNPSALVIRTSWLFSMFGRNFVKNMINRMDHYDDMKIVYDQVGTPTYAEDLARAVMQIISDVDSGKTAFSPGLFHYSNEGVCSWYDLAMEICRLITCKGIIFPVETDEYPRPAKRPVYSVLSKSKIKEVYGVEVPYWRMSLEKCIKNLL